MAIDARLIQENLNRSLQSVAPATNLLSGIQTGQGLLQNQQQLQQGDIQNQLLQQQLTQQQAINPLQQQALQQRLATGEQALSSAQQTQDLAVQTAALQSLGTAAKTLKPFIDSGDLIGAAGQIDVLQGLGIDPEILQDIDQLISTGNLGEISQQIATIENLNRANAGEGEIIKSSQRLVNIDGQQFSEVDVVLPDGSLSTIRTEVGGGIARKTTGETITEQREAEVTQERLEEEAKVLGKVKGEAKTVGLVAKTKSQIIKAVKGAEAEAKATGETLTDIKRAEAALPGLRDVVSQLKDLAPLVTHTIGGKIIDTAAKELGFGSTKGATARAKFIAIIDNQVLPLLKPTFGAAFTVQEGENLKATLGDPDSAPEEKIAQLNAFIDGKVRDLESKAAELNPPSPTVNRIRFDAQGNIIQ